MIIGPVRRPVSAGVFAFPGALGFGRDSLGGRGGTVYKVTNLNDSGAGSLRAAVTATGARHVIFEVSGTIQLASRLTISNPFISIWGQTAPSPGILLRDNWIRIDTNNVTIQHLVLRPGDADGTTIQDGFEVWGSSGTKTDIIIDHCSVSWAIDENASTGTSTTRNRISFTNNIISECLHDSYHPDGVPHSKGLLIGQGSTNISVIRNLFAHDADRNPWFKGNTTGRIINNVAYNWGTSYGILVSGTDGGGAAQFADIIGNVLIKGLNSQAGTHPVRLGASTPAGSAVYASDNSLDRAAPPADPQWGSAVVINDGAPTSVQASSPQLDDGCPILANAQVEAHVEANAGARPADRNAIDTRVINEMNNGTGVFKNTVADGGGWPTYAQNTRTLTPPANGTDIAPNGYTVFENWVHDNYTSAVEP